MSNRNARQPAFPRAGSENRTSGDMPDGNEYDRPEDGLTKREHFAGLAMQGMLAWGDSTESYPDHDIGPFAVKMADALLAALETPAEPAPAAEVLEPALRHIEMLEGIIERLATLDPAWAKGSEAYADENLVRPLKAYRAAVEHIAQTKGTLAAALLAEEVSR